LKLKKTNDQTLGEAIQELIKTYRLEDKLNQARLIKSWDTVTGEMISRHTEKLFVKGNKLYIKLDSDALKNELIYARTKLVKMLNDSVGSEIITEIVFL
jgi:predicted nucleic acid-binding Zn ribbon protein